MKLLIVGLVCTSLSTFASTLDFAVSDAAYQVGQGPVTGEEAKKIERALIVSLSERDFKCTGNWSIENVRATFNSLYDSYTQTVTISQSNTLPSLKTFAKDETYEYNYEFTLTKDAMRIESVIMTVNSIQSLEENSGTIIRPHWEMVTKRTNTYNANCNAKNI